MLILSTVQPVRIVATLEGAPSKASIKADFRSP